jgi:UDP-N-acetylmuramate dehydrogenase
MEVKLELSVPLKNYTTFKIGGPAKYFLIAKSKADLVSGLEKAKELKAPVFILGGGSNILVSDKGFNGLVIKVEDTDFKIENEKILAGAGLSLTKFSYLAADEGFSGFEWAGGIPGTVGGAIFGHAQAFGDKISDTLESVEVLDEKTLKFKTLPKAQCGFSLKNSIFKKNKNLIIISAVFAGKPDDKEKIRAKIKDYLEHRKSRHPISFPSAGSVFVNPEVKIRDKKLLKDYPELFVFNEKGAIHSGYLIEKVGLKGKKIGGAQISDQHANFIINVGDAKAKDVLGLIKLAKQKVKKTFNIELETEVQMVGF